MSQGPAGVRIAEAELSGIDVYGLVQIPSGDLLLSTNQSLMRFDGYDFHTYRNEAQKSNSLFGLTHHPNGKTYCLNLTGQVFVFAQDSLHLLLELPDSLVSSGMDFLVSGDQLVLSCRKLLLMQEDGSFQALKSPEARVFGPRPAIPGSDKIICSTSNGQGLFEWDLSHPNNPPKNYPLPLTLLAHGSPEVEDWDRGLIIQNLPGLDYYLLKADTLSPFPLSISREASEEAANRIFFPNKDEFWIPTISGGLLAFDWNDQARYGGKICFPGTRFSSFLIDHEGNHWLGTLGQGLVLIPTPALENLSLPPLQQGATVNHLCASEKGKTFVSIANQGIYQISPQKSPSLINPLEEKGQRPFLMMEWLKISQRLAIGSTHQLTLLDPKAGRETSINLNSTPKSLQELEDGQLAIASSAWLLLPQDHQNLRIHRLAEKYFKNPQRNGFLHSDLFSRSNCLLFEENTKKLWVGTSTGLQVLSEEGLRTITHEGQPVVALRLIQSQNSIWVAGSQQGLLRLKGEKIEQQFTQSDGLLSNEIRDVLLADDELVLRFREGIQVLNPQTGQIRTLDHSDGLAEGAPTDFALIGKMLWISTPKGVQRIPLSQISNNPEPPLLSLESVKVNGHPWTGGFPAKFSHDENEIEFNFPARAWRHQGKLRYHTRLEGAESTWQISPWTQPSVRFSSLDNGDYVFHLKAENEDGVLSPELSFPFTIRPPFYQTWWFILLVFAGLATFLSLIFRYRIRSIQRQNRILSEKQQLERDLIDSRLTALRSQMNPHFLFNALNSIQEYIILNEKNLAAEYLGKFADLTRTYLRQSQSTEVPLLEEIETLQLYLELEKLRLEEDFSFTIRTASGLQAAGLQIPSLLIQPFVENAVKHGLLHKHGPKRLEVIFGPGNSPNTIRVEVIDNGIGREAAEALKNRRQPSHISFASSSTQSRLELTSRSRGIPVGVKIHDLRDATGSAAGTHVILNIPTSPL